MIWWIYFDGNGYMLCHSREGFSLKCVSVFEIRKRKSMAKVAFK